MGLNGASFQVSKQSTDVVLNANHAIHHLRASSIVYTGINGANRSQRPRLARAPSSRTQLNRMALGACAAVIPCRMDRFFGNSLRRICERRVGSIVCGPGPVCQALANRHLKPKRRPSCLRRAALAEDRVEPDTKQCVNT